MFPKLIGSVNPHCLLASRVRSGDTAWRAARRTRRGGSGTTFFRSSIGEVVNHGFLSDTIISLSESTFLAVFHGG